MSNLIISIDGPAGSGKQRIAKFISKKYKFFHLDSGVLYRRLAFLLIKNKIKETNSKEIENFVKYLKILSTKDHKSLRKEDVTKISSKIAIFSFVRNFINKQQRTIVKKMLKTYIGCVVDGRDIGSKVFKDAKIKLFINVKIEIRAKRRHKQLIELGETSIYAKILKEIKLRDKLDKSRKNSPLVIPEGALIIDNSSNFKLTLKQVNQALNHLK